MERPPLAPSAGKLTAIHPASVVAEAEEAGMERGEGHHGGGLRPTALAPSTASSFLNTTRI